MILVLTHSRDFYNIDIFFDYLQSKNIPCFRLNTDQINHLQQISLNPNGHFHITDEDGREISSDDITAVWHRKSWAVNTPEELPDSFAEIFRQEYSALRNNLYNALADIPWINSLQAEYFVERNKMRQLQVAATIGLDVPETLFTNSGPAVRKFLDDNKFGKAVAKLHGPRGQSMNGEALVETMLIDASEEHDFDSLAYCPMIIQPYIDKEYELRIAYVDGKCFTGKVNSNRRTDWRTMQDASWDAYELPREISDKLTALMLQLGLTFGAIDLIKGTDGKYWFLEVNPQGEWGMLQKDLDYPIAESIADYLINRIKLK